MEEKTYNEVWDEKNPKTKQLYWNVALDYKKSMD